MMNCLPPLQLSFPPNLSDEAAYEIHEFLDTLTLAFEERYFRQIRRHYRQIHPKRSDLSECPWEPGDDEEPPF